MFLECGLAEQGDSSLKISAVYQKVFAVRHIERKGHPSPTEAFRRKRRWCRECAENRVFISSKSSR